MIRVEVRGNKALAANFRALDRRLQKEVIDTNQVYADRIQVEAVRNAPASQPGDYPGAGTHRLKRSIQQSMSDSGYVFYVYCDPALFEAEGFPYYPIWVHNGTRRMAARPFLQLAYEQEKGGYSRAIGDAVRRAIARSRA